MEAIKTFLSYSFAEISVADLLIFLLCMVTSIVLDKLTRWGIKKLEARLEAKNQTTQFKSALLTSISKPLHLFFLTTGASFGIYIIDTPSWGIELFNIIRDILNTIGIWCVIWYLLRVADRMTGHMMNKANESGNKLHAMAVPLMRGIAKFLIAGIGILVILQNLGYNVSSIVTGLGIGGAAIALAAKDTIANFFGAIVVFIDHPFDLGDWVTLSGVEGTVEEIRLRSTIIRTFDNSLVTIPNSTLSNANINNFQRRKTRRMDCNFGVLYSTKAEQIELIVNNLKQYVVDHPELLDEKCYIGFGGFGDSSLNIFVTVYSVKTKWAEFCVVRQTFLLAIMRIVEDAGTSFAFPTRTLEFSTNSSPLALTRADEKDEE